MWLDSIHRWGKDASRKAAKRVKFGENEKILLLCG
jgi:hypothetical protein